MQGPQSTYELIKRLSRHSFAERWFARYKTASGFRKGVLLRLLPSFMQAPIDETLGAFCLQELAINLRLEHPGLPHHYVVGIAERGVTIVREYVPGVDLRALLDRLAERSERLPLELSVWIVLKLCEVLHYVYQCDSMQVHRDLDPGHVLISFLGEVKLIGVGEGRVQMRYAQYSSPPMGVVEGRFEHLSPEQVCGRELDRRSDVFSLGTLLCKLATGAHPFRGRNCIETIKAIHAAQTPQCAGLPPLLERIIRRAVQKERAARFQSAGEMAQALFEYTYRADDHSSTRALRRYVNARFPAERGWAQRLINEVVSDNIDSEVDTVRVLGEVRAMPDGA